MWAKSCEIGNASKGSLSSYSYIIMLIHYLQRTNPPVAPFLQEVCFSVHYFQYFTFLYFLPRKEYLIFFFSNIVYKNFLIIHHLMCIYEFLQITPPGKYREPIIIDDCDVYFCSFENLVSLHILFCLSLPFLPFFHYILIFLSLSLFFYYVHFSSFTSFVMIMIILSLFFRSMSLFYYLYYYNYLLFVNYEFALEMDSL